MNQILMNPWIITIIGGIIVGLVVLLVTRRLGARNDEQLSDATNVNSRKHLIEVGNGAHVESGGVVQAGDRGKLEAKNNAGRRHDIELHEKGTIIAQGDVVAGDTKDP